MAERTVTNDRLVDGEKLDRLEKNGTGKISMTSLVDGSITDQDMLDIMEEIGGGGSGTPTAPIEKNDIKTYSGLVVVLDNTAKTIKFVFPDLSYTLYSETGYSDHNSDSVGLTTYSIPGVYSTTGPHTIITYSDGTVVNVDGIGGILLNGGTIAYTNKGNVFTMQQKFKEQAIFEKTLVTNFRDDTVYVGNTVTLDMRFGNTRKLVLTKNTNLKLAYLITGAVYNIFIVKNGYGIRITDVEEAVVSSGGVVSSVNLTNGTYWVGGVISPVMEDGVASPVVTVSAIVGDSAIHLTAMGTKQVALPTPY